MEWWICGVDGTGHDTHPADRREAGDGDSGDTKAARPAEADRVDVPQASSCLSIWMDGHKMEDHLMCQRYTDSGSGVLTVTG
uniref:Uncharacterized protein n=1 Tax=Oryza sativa subsp. japonica TaxID=39947 RepID=Q653G9_ORYSJ|nr:hypothetical protein [Oryza sativa Japonica Group]